MWDRGLGTIEAAHMESITPLLRAGTIPLLPSMGRCVETGQTLTFSTADAAKALAREIQPLKAFPLIFSAYQSSFLSPVFEHIGVATQTHSRYPHYR
jgi:acetylglutamate kinase